MRRLDGLDGLDSLGFGIEVLKKVWVLNMSKIQKVSMSK